MDAHTLKPAPTFGEITAWLTPRIISAKSGKPEKKSSGTFHSFRNASLMKRATKPLSKSTITTLISFNAGKSSSFSRRFLAKRRLSINAGTSSPLKLETIHYLVGPKPFQPVQRLVDGRKFVNRNAANLFHGHDVLAIQRLDNSADLLAFLGDLDAN